MLFSGNKFISDSGSSLQMLGSQFACIVASLCYAIGSIITRLCPPVGTLPYATSGLLVGAIILLPLAILLEETPLSLKQIVEKINLLFLKINYQQKSEINVKDYILNLNNKTINKDNKKIKLTEKELEIILFLASKKTPQKIKLQNYLLRS